MTDVSSRTGIRGAELPDAQPVPAARKSDEDGHSSAATRSKASGGEGAAKPAKQRDAFFDNAKYLAIVLVAMGHAWEPLRDGSRAASALYIAVYTFHMPAFIIISGYFSRSFDMRRDRLMRLVTGVAVPYVIFEVAYSLFKRWADDDPGHPISLLDPWYLTWFLIALFIWRITTPLWKLVRWPVPLSLAIAVLASVSPDIGDDLDLQRVLQFLPFFVVGLCLKPEHFQLVRRKEARLLAVPVFAAALVFAYWAAPRMNAAWFYRRDSAQELGAPAWSGGVMTLAMFGCSIVLAACFFAWVPRRHMWFTVLGAGTLYGYLLHGFLAKGSRFWDWYDADWMQQPLGAIALTLIAAAIITTLCTPPVQRMFRFAMEPKMEWAFKRDAAALAKAEARAKREPTDQPTSGRDATSPARRH
ncbi:Acyltransferase family protein [Streptomyces sp. YIM 130001]|uniref:acyltransferase family protein n=1 Tax=Streptomyces sp. YIM 130001 TaxID=2259644 RepID=UPI000EDF9EE6|nr:acyltransferase family protein [Streptomyces sp. YIM 130001]RII15661.1 Acyltransferase family protein [Streptomyces sp. YIM 130001]